MKIASILKPFLIAWPVTIVVVIAATHFIPKKYESVIAVTKTDNFRSAEGISVIERRLNINLDRTNTIDIVSSYNYPDIVSDSYFLVSLANEFVTNSQGEEVSVYSLYGKGEVPSDPNHMTVQQANTILKMQKNIECKPNKKTGLLEIRSKAKDAAAAAQIAHLVFEKLHERILAIRYANAERDAAYYTALTDKLLNELSLSTSDRDREVKMALYTSVYEQKIAAEMLLRQDSPVIVIVNDATVAWHPVSRKRLPILLISLVLVSGIIVLVKYPQQIKKAISAYL